MSTTEVRTNESSQAPAATTVDAKLEVVVIPVSDVDRAQRFYAALGWRLDAEFAKDDFRVVQVTPPGSGTSVIFGKNVTSAEPGSAQGLHLVVSDIEAARSWLIDHGADVSELFHDVGGVFHHAGDDGRVSGPDPERRSYCSFASFSDPDGNGWLLQEITERLPGRVDPSQTSFASPSDLAQALQRAAAAHGKHEERTGQADPDWPAWYAEYMVREQSGETLPT
jgi:catechol 2,3-dioxygenase-like lactoylglutathione lyase family enzyme